MEQPIRKGKPARRWSWRAEARNPINIWVFLSVHPAILIAEFSVSNNETFREQLIQMAFTWYGLIISLGVLLALRWLLGKLNLLSGAPWPLLLLVGATTGLTADVATAVLEGADLTQFLLNIPEQNRFAIFLGMLLAIASGLLEGARDNFDEMREAIISERVRLAAAGTRQRSGLLETFVLGSKARLREGTSEQNLGDFAQSVRTFIAEELRPMSHRLWEREGGDKKQFTYGLLISRVLSKPVRYPIMVGAFAVLAGSRSVLSREPVMGWLSLASLLALVVGTLYLFSLWHRSRFFPNALRPVSLPISAVLAAAAAVPSPGFFIEYDTRIVPLNYWLVAMFVILIGSIITSTIAEVRLLLADQAKELRELLNAEELTRSQATALASVRARDAANFLHSTTQNKLLALALRFEASPNQPLTDGDIGELDKILDEALEPSQDRLPLETGVARLAESWRGLVAIAAQVSDDGLSEAKSELAILAIREAVTNSYRHGSATEISIEIAQVGKDFRIKVVDNGKGPMGNRSGLGFRVFNILGRWTLKSSRNGGAVLEIFTSA